MPSAPRYGVNTLCLAVVALVMLVSCAPLTGMPAQGTVAPEGTMDAASPVVPAPTSQRGGLGPLTPAAPWPGGTVQIGACPLPAVTAPTPAPDPGYTQLDPSTGLHMTGTPADLDLATYRLEVTGKVAHALSLSFDELRCLPRVEARPRLVCPGFFVDNAAWAGASLAAVLALAEPAPDAHYVELVGADGYSSLPEIERALDPANFLAYEWEGQPVPVLHGFPVRAVLPKEEGNRWVKWLIKIEVK